MDVEDPGGWQVGHLGSLFDVLGTRSGKGSNWFEVDLVFALDLGPVRVEGATIRATVDGGGLDVTLRGLAVTLAFPGAGGGLDVIEGKCQLKIVTDADTGRPITDIRLAAIIPPLNLAADAYLMTADHGPDGNQARALTTWTSSGTSRSVREVNSGSPRAGTGQDTSSDRVAGRRSSRHNAVGEQG